MNKYHSYLNHSVIPQNTIESLARYETQGIMPGGFLYAALTNDLMAAVTSADADNLKCIKAICQYIYNELPEASHGSPAAVRDWVKMIRAQTMKLELVRPHPQLV